MQNHFSSNSVCSKISNFAVVLVVALFPAGCAKEPTAESLPTASGDSPKVSRELTDVTLQLNWFPEAEHGGYYAAHVHGYFEEAGLRVQIVKGGPGVPVIQNVGTQRMTFGLSNADQILVGRGQEADVVAVFAPLQTSPRCIMVHAKSGIKNFDELKNVTLAINENSTFGSILKHKLPLTGCKIEPYPGSIAKFLLTDNFAQQGYVFSEPFLATQEGAVPHVLMAAEIGFNPYTSVLITHGDTIKNQSDVVQKMVTACRKGWVKYLEDSTQTDAHIQKENSEIDQNSLAHGAKELRKLCLSSDVTADKIGQMTQERWQSMFDQMVESGVSEKDSVNVSIAFTTRFLEAAVANVNAPNESTQP